MWYNVNMVINREMDYAVRILRQLDRDGFMTAAAMSEREDVSLDFARNILRKLKKAGMVEILRGAGGGYQLTRSCADLTLWDVKQAVDPEPMMNRCMADGYVCNGSCGNACAVHQECARIEAIMEAELSRKSLKEIFDAER